MKPIVLPLECASGCQFKGCRELKGSLPAFTCLTALKLEHHFCCFLLLGRTRLSSHWNRTTSGSQTSASGLESSHQPPQGSSLLPYHADLGTWQSPRSLGESTSYYKHEHHASTVLVETLTEQSHFVQRKRI